MHETSGKHIIQKGSENSKLHRFHLSIVRMTIFRKMTANIDKNIGIKTNVT